MRYSLKGIGTALAAEREQRGLTQREFAQMAGTTQARISRIENGETDARLSTVIELARALDLELTLIPRRHLPAVSAILGRQKSKSEEKPIRAALDRLRNLIAPLREHIPQNEDLRTLDRTSRELMNFQLTEDIREPIQKVLDAVKLVSDTPALANTLDKPAQALRRVRNDLAHRLPDDASGPRPAHRLDEEDDE